MHCTLFTVRSSHWDLLVHVDSGGLEFFFYFFWNFSFGKEERREIFDFVSRDALLPIVQSMVISSWFMALGDFGVLAGLMRIIIH